MNYIAPKLQKCWTHKTAFNIISKMLKQPISFTVSLIHFQRTHLQSFTFYDFWIKFDYKFCSPYPTVDFLRIFDHQNRKPLPKGLKSTNSLTAEAVFIERLFTELKLGN